MSDWCRLRAEFPALENCTYLNTATFGQLPRRGVDALMHHLRRRDRYACADFLSWFDDVDRIRESCARLVNCTAADIAFVANAATGLAYLMQGLDWKRGDEVLTLDGEFPNQLYQAVPAHRLGATFRTVPWSDLYGAINEQTRVVMLSTVNYASGFRPPIDKISQYLTERRVLLYVDGTQSIGALQFDVQEVRPSMLCVDAYKWLMSPNGAAFVYIDPQLRDRLPATTVGWRSDVGWRDVDRLNPGTPNFIASAEKYEGGMISFPCIYAMGAAVDMLLEVGPARIEHRVLELAESTRSMFTELGAEVNNDKSQIVTAWIPGCDAAALARMLKEKSIVLSVRCGRLRVSPHFYNSETDIEMLGAALK